MDSLQTLMSQLSDKDLLTMLALQLGYEEVPVDIETFLNDEYYLGKSCGINPLTGKSAIFPIWHEALAKVYPDPIRTSTYVANCGCTGCLHGDTLICLDEGYATIKELYDKYPNGGFVVKSYNIDEQRFEMGICHKVYYNGRKSIYELILSDKNFSRTTIYCTGEHRFLLTSGKYKEAKDLRPRDKIVSSSGVHLVDSLVKTDRIEDVYDLTVDCYHNYCIRDINGNAIVVHNSGKSTMSKIIIAYDIYKLTKLKDPAGYFGLIQKYLHFVVFNLTKENAEKMVKELKSWLEESPYFQEQKKDNQSVYQWVCIDPASRMQDIISNDVITIVYSEMNFVNNFEQGIKLINQGISRIEGRFQKGLGLFNHVVLDSSDSTIDAPVPNFLRFHPRGPETLVFSYAIWEAKKDMYFHITDPETGKKTFTVYKGDSEIMPCIVTKDTKTENMDPDRFLEVPLELLPDFQADIELNLNDKAGVAVETTTQYFKAAYVTPHMTYDMGGIPEIISIDFFNGETYQPYFEDLMQKLPKDRCLFGRLDLGLVKDKAGFAIGYIESMNEKNLDGIVTYDPSVVIPCAVSFSRYTGQETNIDKLTDLIIWMHSKIPFFRFTTDQYQSSAIRQRLIIAGIQADLLSVDRKTDAYKVAKQMIYQGKVQLPKCTLLKNELLNLMDLGKKIDHHETLNANGDIGSDSKDVADALAGLLYTMHEATPEAMDPPILSNTQWEEYNKRILEGWVEESQKRYIKQTNSFNFGETAFFGHELDL